MTKLLSNQELRYELELLVYPQCRVVERLNLSGSSLFTVDEHEVDRLVEGLAVLIDKQTLAHGNMVIGDDEDPNDFRNNSYTTTVRNNLRLEQRLRNQTGDKS